MWIFRFNEQKKSLLFKIIPFEWFRFRRFGKTSQRSVLLPHPLANISSIGPLRSVSNWWLSSDYRLVGYVIESLVTDEFDCGLRCVRNKKCQSYNCFSDEHHDNKTCELNDQTRHSKPTDFRANKGFTYYGKGREIATSMHQTSKLIRLRQRFYTANNLFY